MKGMHPLLEKGLLFLRSEIFKPLFLETGAGSSGFTVRRLEPKCQNSIRPTKTNVATSTTSMQ
jgi:hypothetical protein